jgi:hypothetical protein
MVDFQAVWAGVNQWVHPLLCAWVKKLDEKWPLVVLRSVVLFSVFKKN